MKRPISPEDHAQLLWLRYHVMTEAYDRLLPHTIHDFTGDAIPHDGYARDRSMRFTRMCGDIVRRMLDDGTTTSHDARKTIGRTSYPQQCAWLAELEKDR